jgi:membrane protein YqaA with SNARE-associated domain
MMSWASHAHAQYYLAGVSFAEASVFPIPPDIMLAPMVLAKPNHWLKLAFLTTLFSVLGGMLGYFIGYSSFELVGQVIIDVLHLQTGYENVVQWFDKWGVGMILLAGITPIPYKLFTIAAGVSKMSLLPFVFGSIIGRMTRFVIVAGLTKKLGPTFEKRVLHYIDHLGWLLVGLLILGLCLLQLW